MMRQSPKPCNRFKVSRKPHLVPVNRLCARLSDVSSHRQSAYQKHSSACVPIFRGSGRRIAHLSGSPATGCPAGTAMRFD
jgi:hypothetical protein